MGIGRNWTAAEYDYLQDNWGVVSLQGICKTLNRSENAINTKVFRLGLGSFLECGEYVTFNQLLIAIGYNNASYKDISWIENRGFPVKYKTVNKCKFRVVYLDDFWKWAEANKGLLDFTNFEPLALGKEPEWVKDKRKIDFSQKQMIRMSPWTKQEDAELAYLLNQFKFGYSEISEKLHRTCGAVQRRICDLGLKARPIKAYNHNTWTNEDKALLGQLINRGFSYTLIGKELNRSAKAIQGLVARVYNTENLDNVRGMIKGRDFGDGAYIFNVYEKRRTAAVKTDIQRLIAALKYRRNSSEYGEYWQRLSCMHWNDYEGCKANEADCDSCASFRRIPPQGCVRCGCTFFERDKNNVCKPCRDIRKKQAQRKWFATGNKQNIKLDNETE